jgi:hypothetical protein
MSNIKINTQAQAHGYIRYFILSYEGKKNNLFRKKFQSLVKMCFLRKFTTIASTTLVYLHEGYNAEKKMTHTQKK